MASSYKTAESGEIAKVKDYKTISKLVQRGDSQLKTSANPLKIDKDQQNILQFGKPIGKTFKSDTNYKRNSVKPPHQSVSRVGRPTHKPVKTDTNHETILQRSNSQHGETTGKHLKIYVYNMSSEFTTNISACAEEGSTYYFSYCIDHSNHGMGALLYRHGLASIHNTNHFSLDFILHHQFVNSQYRTNDPHEADIFYIPAYMGSLSFCPEYILEKTKRLFQYLKTMPYFAQGKPHVTSLSKIEIEQTKIVLAHPGWKNITYITIEKASKQFNQIFGVRSHLPIVAPYPSYVHFNYSMSYNTYAEEVQNHKRSIFLFLAASLRVSNPFRAKIIAQFLNKTDLSFKNYMDDVNTDQVMLITKECAGNHNNLTIEWMFNSVFCLQPHGDSPTRKSFYDSILSGCIPVVFKFPYEDVEFPFQRTLNYSNFMVQIPVDEKGDLERNITYYDYLRRIPQPEIKRLHMNLVKVLHCFQYPVIDTKQKDHPKDAVDMIVDEIRAVYNI